MSNNSNDLMTEALAKLREKFGSSGQQMGGKGTARRKTKKIRSPNTYSEKKFNDSLKRLGTTNIQGIEEVQIIKNDDKVLHFSPAKVQAAAAANTYIVSGKYQVKDCSNLLPQVLQQLKLLNNQGKFGHLPDQASNLCNNSNSNSSGGIDGNKSLFPSSAIKDPTLQELFDNHTDLSSANLADILGHDNNFNNDPDDYIPDTTNNFEEISKE